jgi:hypothetical protein
MPPAPAAQRRTYPPTMFVHMPRDGRTAAYVKGNAAALRKLRVPVRRQPGRPPGLLPHPLLLPVPGPGPGPGPGPRLPAAAARPAR